MRITYNTIYIHHGSLDCELVHLRRMVCKVVWVCGHVDWRDERQCRATKHDRRLQGQRLHQAAVEQRPHFHHVAHEPDDVRVRIGWRQALENNNN